MARRVPYAAHRDGFCDVHGASRRRVLLVHGGFWRRRYDLTLMSALADDLAARGWEAWNAEYRRLGLRSRWPQMSEDLRAAARCARAHAAVGHSAGGQLALWLGAEGLVGAVAAQAPVSDLAGAARLSGGVVARLGAPAGASPLARVPLGVPVLVVHGERDGAVPVAMSRAFAAAARAAGDEVAYDERPGEGHFEHLDPRSGAWRSVCDWLEALA